MGGWADKKIKLLTERYIKCKDILHENRAGKKIKVLSQRGKDSLLKREKDWGIRSCINRS